MDSNTTRTFQPIPLRSFIQVNYPGTVVNDADAVASLGGTAAISKAVGSKDESIPLNFGGVESFSGVGGESRDGSGVSKSTTAAWGDSSEFDGGLRVTGNHYPSASLLVKFRRRKRPRGDAKDIASARVLGRIIQRVDFNKLADFRAPVFPSGSRNMLRDLLSTALSDSSTSTTTKTNTNATTSQPAPQTRNPSSTPTPTPTPTLTLIAPYKSEIHIPDELIKDPFATVKICVPLIRSSNSNSKPTQVPRLRLKQALTSDVEAALTTGLRLSSSQSAIRPEHADLSLQTDMKDYREMNPMGRVRIDVMGIDSGAIVGSSNVEVEIDGKRSQQKQEAFVISVFPYTNSQDPNHEAFQGYEDKNTTRTKRRKRRHFSTAGCADNETPGAEPDLDLDADADADPDVDAEEEEEDDVLLINDPGAAADCDSLAFFDPYRDRERNSNSSVPLTPRKSALAIALDITRYLQTPKDFSFSPHLQAEGLACDWGRCSILSGREGERGPSDTGSLTNRNHPNPMTVTDSKDVSNPEFHVSSAGISSLVPTAFSQYQHPRNYHFQVPYNINTQHTVSTSKELTLKATTPNQYTNTHCQHPRN